MADLLRNTFFSVAILSLFSLPAHGKDVTAPPLPSVSSLSQSGRLITITKAMIDESAANSLAEMLSQFVGIYAYHRGGNGQPVITNVRGNRSGDVLFLLNDVSIQSAISSTSAIHRIPLEIIDRIEIAYGPNSALYGSSALAAVIKIYTNLPNEERLHTDLLIGAGSESTYKLKASLNGKIRKTQIGIEVLQHKTDGINSYLSDMWPDSDGTTYGTVGFSLTNQLSKKLKIGVQGLYINGTREFDYQFPETEEESIDEQWSIRAEYKY